MKTKMPYDKISLSLAFILINTLFFSLIFILLKNAPTVLQLFIVAFTTALISSAFLGLKEARPVTIPLKNKKSKKVEV
jgi:uncharacterized membrane protein